MSRSSEIRAWIVLLAAAIGLVVACSSSTTTPTGEGDAAKAMTPG